MKDVRSSVLFIVAVLFAFPASVVAQSAPPEQSPLAATPRALLSGSDLVEIYPVVFDNAMGLNSTLLVSCLTGGRFEIAAVRSGEEAQSFPMEIAPGTVREISMQELGLANGVGTIVVIAADEETSGGSVIVVQSQTGGVDLMEPLTADPALFAE